MSSRFNKELKELVRDEVISSEIADCIYQYYDKKKTLKPNRLFTIFGIFGALLVGSGIILMLAHNWDNFSRITKTVLAFVPLIIGQCVAGFSILKNKSNTWKEASGTFLFFAVGASISLVSQIYNISGDLGSFLRTWILLCLPLLYVLRSHAVALLLVLSSTYYATEVGLWNFRNNSTPWLYLGFIAAIIPHYWIQLRNAISSNTTSIFNWILPASITVGLASFIRGNEELGFIMYMTLFGIFYNIGKLSVFKELRTLRNGYLIIGSLGTIILLMIFTFRWPWDEIYDTTMYVSQELYTSLLLGSIGISVLGHSIVKKGVRSVNLFQVSFLVFWAFFFLLSGMTTLPMILTNVLVFVLGITAIKIGADTFNFGILNYGLLIISVLIICRFFDTDMSFVVRGALFVIVGIGFFAANYMMLKRQQLKHQIIKK
ncbi:DUF2157 domain-containing protein [Aquimarina sp. 2201CG14-23]|uniref:DUF2157 domain-containing protein n=1 Tax=Aquimarina mycalae TaxID=3040073 RepID=UPI002477F788|nr:DUF2157 domain-containing protein [Aquimarina sp. 2201CG14-23]MDH7447842.1 DUF2157 domain-containing protein [Aquimarina sp. 2201CG14-23]